MDRDDVVPLPRGRHRLSREQVVSSQRLRMLAAMAAAAAAAGYVRTSVAEVLRRARVSRETFYEQFADKEDCFLAAYDTGVELTLAAYLRALADRPDFARTFLIEIYAVGPPALARRAQLQHGSPS